MKQSVSDEGYFMTYKYARMPNTLGLSGIGNNGVEAMDYSHGSGTIDTESILSTQSSDDTNYGVDENYDPDHSEALSCIQLKEDNAMTYSPIAFGVGTGFYAGRPLQFNILLNAHVLDKELDLLAKDFMVSKEDAEENKFVVNSAWKKPLVDVDEDYWGTYHIEKLMNLTASVDETEEDDDWLPCCSGGYLTMADAYQKGSKGFGSDVKSIFDCTCFKVPTKAEFPR